MIGNSCGTVGGSPTASSRAPSASCGLGGDAAQPGQFGAQFVAGVGDLGRRLDLAAGQLELQLHPARLGVAGDGLVAGDRLAGFGVDEQELLLDADCGMRWPRVPPKY